MLVFGHLGITLGVVKACEFTIFHTTKRKLNINYIVVGIGALLPDLLDKPVVQFLYGLKNHNSHMFAHTFLFSGSLVVLGLIILMLLKNNSLLILGITSLMHQLMDKGLFLFGDNSSPFLISQSIKVLRHLGFSQSTIMKLFGGNSYFSNILLYFMTPYVFVSEIIGFTIIVFLILNHIRVRLIS